MDRLLGPVVPIHKLPAKQFVIDSIVRLRPWARIQQTASRAVLPVALRQRVLEPALNDTTLVIPHVLLKCTILQADTVTITEYRLA